ncbi:sulfatase-like hydrolase/transferase [Neiella sp. HB171785]|uniref:Sulfatase-like hydrolase/transferase n=1 Tax=Neiella litorisoli TaxID=2771431 RepID=A0A8J6QFG1_9GAMM|nr:sulfatase-like hydrolase/transferase [Neiella litorisoli]MBD1388355.1 sulfatase-like hydrolase/transferase [Neiella litorisoli]
MKTQLSIGLIALVSLLAGNACIAATNKADDRPNILFILTDDQGYADVGFNGSTDLKTPSIDELAENGTVFTSAYVVHPFCGPSRAGLMTGRYPHKFGSQFNLPATKDSGGLGLPTDESYISEVLQDAGYFTGIVGKWHLGEMHEHHPNQRGFDEFFGFLNGGHSYFPADYQKKYQAAKDRGLDSAIWQYLAPMQYNGEEVKETEYVTDALSREASRFIEKASHKDEPFFLYLAYNAPHTPLEAKEEDMALFPDIKDKKRKTYAGMVWALDRGINNVVKTLKDTGQYDNTLIVFMSDNGGRPDQGANNYPLKEGKNSVQEGGYRTPMFMHWPAKMKAGKTYKHPVSSLDMFPTLAQLAGATIPADKDLDGVDILPAVQQDVSARPGDLLYVMVHWADHTNVAARRDNLKVIRTENGPWRLYDVQADPAENNDLSAQYPDTVREMVSKMSVWSWSHQQPAFFYNHKSAAQWRLNGMPRFDQTFELKNK